MKARLRIGVDIDGVLIDTDPKAFLEFCKKELGWNASYDVFVETSSWYRATGKDSAEVIGEAFAQFIVNVEESQKPIEGAHDALRKLGGVADIYLITARSGILRKVTEEFIQEHLFDVQYHELSMENLYNKVQKLKDFELDYFIDDSYGEIAAVLENKELKTNIIPFPSFHGIQHWKNLKDDRVHWLYIWESIKHGLPADEQAMIRKKAWEEITKIIL